MRSNHSRRSRVGPSDDNSPLENRQRPVQKAVRYIPGEHFLAWGERWIPAPGRKSCKALTNSGAPVFKIEHGLSEFPLDSPPALNPGGHAPSIPPVVYSHSVRPTKRKNRRTRKCAPYLASSPQRSRASTEEPGLDTLNSGLFSTSLQAAESVATSAPLSGGYIASGDVFYPVPQVYDTRNPVYNHRQHEVSAGSLTLQGSQILPYGAMGSTISPSQVSPFPDTTLGWRPNDGTNLFPPAAPCYYHQREVDAMGHGTCLNHFSSDPRLPHLNKPYTRPHVQMLYQTQAYDIGAPDKQSPS